MVQLVKCKNCDKTTIPFGEVAVSIILQKTEWCQGCSNSNTEEQSHYFCSEGCFREYMAKVLNGKEVLTWTQTI